MSLHVILSVFILISLGLLIYLVKFLFDLSFRVKVSFLPKKGLTVDQTGVKSLLESKKNFIDLNSDKSLKKKLDGLSFSIWVKFISTKAEEDTIFEELLRTLCHCSLIRTCFEGRLTLTKLPTPRVLQKLSYSLEVPAREKELDLVKAGDCIGFNFAHYENIFLIDTLVETQGAEKLEVVGLEKIYSLILNEFKDRSEMLVILRDNNLEFGQDLYEALSEKGIHTRFKYVDYSALLTLGVDFIIINNYSKIGIILDQVDPPTASVLSCETGECYVQGTITHCFNLDFKESKVIIGNVIHE